MKQSLKISVIIPSYNDLELARNNCELLNPDGSLECIIIEAGLVEPSNSLYSSTYKAENSGRAAQQNQGAEIAKGEVLCFLHADTFIVRSELINAAQSLAAENDCWGGTFVFKLASASRFARIVEYAALIREKLTGVAFGDQCLCIRRDKFLELEGFPDVPIMEDLILIRKLQAEDKYTKFNGSAVTSARKWESNGWVRTCWGHFVVLLKWGFGVSLDELVKSNR